MLRINLLPSYVGQRRLTKQLTAVFIGVFSVVVAGMLAFWLVYLVPLLASTTQNANDAVAAKQQLDNLNQQAQTIQAGVAPVQAKIDFVNQVAAYNEAYTSLYRTVAKYTSPKIIYDSMAVSGKTLTINAYTPSIADVGRYLQVMYNEPDFSSVSISTVPGADTAAEKIYYYNGRIIGSTGGTVTAAGQTVVLPGLPPGLNVTLPPGIKLPPPVVLPGGGLGVTGSAADAYSEILTDPHFNPKLFKVVVHHTDGFPFTITAALKNPPTAPTPPTPGAAAATPGPGGPGGPGGP